MADFREAFQLGIQAHNAAERARQEIFGLLDEFAAQIHEVSNGQVRIERAKREVLVPGENFTRKPRSYDAIAAIDSSGKKEEELCEYSLEERGYPVTLRYANDYVRCHDREALEQALLKLLAHPETGGKLQRLMDHEQAA